LNEAGRRPPLQIDDLFRQISGDSFWFTGLLPSSAVAGAAGPPAAGNRRRSISARRDGYIRQRAGDPHGIAAVPRPGGAPAAPAAPPLTPSRGFDILILGSGTFKHAPRGAQGAAKAEAGGRAVGRPDPVAP